MHHEWRGASQDARGVFTEVVTLGLVRVKPWGRWNLSQRVLVESTKRVLGKTDGCGISTGNNAVARHAGYRDRLAATHVRAVSR